MDKTFDQELHGLSLADLKAMFDSLVWESSDQELMIAVNDEIRRRIDLIKSKQ